MPIAPTCSEEWQDVLGFREGARYRKMDLHTHSPASECSDYRLPADLAGVLPERMGTTRERDEAWGFVRGLADGATAPVRQAWDAYRASHPAYLWAADLDEGAPVRIARWWCDAIACMLGEDGNGPTADQVKARDEAVKHAVADVRRYLSSLLFSEEYVLRCYIEGLELVALTDHNHPGYVVPSLPCLGTWHDALVRVNDACRRDALCPGSQGAKVRAAMVARLKAAQEVLGGSGVVKPAMSGESRTQHAESVRKQLTAQSGRAQHIAERLAHWAAPDNPVRPLTVLPGVEITVSEVHLLGLFPPEWYVPLRIAAILGDIGIPEAHWGVGFLAAASSSVQDTIDLVDRGGGIAIPAHANSDFKGLLRLLKPGLALTKVLAHPALLALETVGGVVIPRKDKAPARRAWETLQWLERGGGPKPGKRLCFTKSSDAHECRIEADGKGEDLGMRYTNVKIEIRDNDTPQETFRSLRLALLAGGDRLIEYPIEDGYNYREGTHGAPIAAAARGAVLTEAAGAPVITGVCAHGAGSYADGVQVRFNPYLNCVIGSGGASTLVRLIAFALGAVRLLPQTAAAWRPRLVRVFWQEGGETFCVDREGTDNDPALCRATVLQLQADGEWQQVARPSEELPALLDIWPPASIQEGRGRLSNYEDDVIAELAARLLGGEGTSRSPLLVNQPVDLFNSDKLFDKLLGKPAFKTRQIIWSTGSVNVPAALDAEKIIVTEEFRRGRQMRVKCAGDLHEDDIRRVYLDHFEGGWAGFSRRLSLYEA